MNNLINLVFLWTMLFFGLDYLQNYFENKLIFKSVFLITVFLFQAVYDTIMAKLYKKKKNFDYLFDSSLLKSLLLLFGLIISQENMDFLMPVINEIKIFDKLDIDIGKTSTIISPLFIFMLVKCFIKPC
jgi:Na+/alanine symporter